MDDFFTQVWTIFTGIVVNLLHPENWQPILKQPGVMIAAFVVLNLIVFTETGLLIGFMLPGDSLLVTAGIVAYGVGWPLPILMATLCVSAIVGDSVGYYIGKRSGPRLFQRPDSRFFKRKYLLDAQAFYERHGGKTIILARFMPFIRTFAPVVAGAASMDYRRFLTYNVVGGIGWVVSMLGLGYLLPMALEEPLQSVFGPQFRIEKQIDKIIIFVIFLSILPMLWAGARNRLQARKLRATKLPTPTIGTVQADRVVVVRPAAPPASEQPAPSGVGEASLTR